MSETEANKSPAWEPLTPRGVASFAHASLGRLLLVQLIVAIVAGASVVWFLNQAWFPVVRQAIRVLPPTGEIKAQRLDWPGTNPVELAQNHFLGIAVDMNHSGRLGREAHLQIEFGREDLRVISLLGYSPVDYPEGWRMAFNRQELEPWWGAWEPGLLVAAGAVTVLALMLIWPLLATIYFLPVKLISFFANRDLNFRQSWRLAGAALMPGALFLTFAIFCHTLGLVDLVRLGGLAILHLLIGLVYLFISPFFLHRTKEAQSAKANPFALPKESAPPPKTK